MAKRVILHVGAPKTGTSFVQDRLFRNPEALAAQGVSYPGDRHDAHFLAALDLIGLKWGGLEHEAVGHWERLAADVRRHDGTVIISHEIFGIASPEHVKRAFASFGDAQIDVVVSARDVARQIPAEWQENIKHRRQLSYADFLKRIQDPARDSVLGWWFWGVQHIPEVLARWGADLPAERVHVVTVPPAGADSGLLWQRFMQVFEIDDAAFTGEAERANPSLGVPETTLVRRLNALLKPALPNHHYRGLVRETLVHQNLSARRDSPRLALPPAAAQWAHDLAVEWVAAIKAAGNHVVGDLSELVPTEAGVFTDPDAPDEAQVAEAGVAGLAAMTLEAARIIDEKDARIQELTDAIARIESAPDYRLKKGLVRLAHTNPFGKAGLGAYRKLFSRD